MIVLVIAPQDSPEDNFHILNVATLQNIDEKCLELSQTVTLCPSDDRLENPSQGCYHV